MMWLPLGSSPPPVDEAPFKNIQKNLLRESSGAH
jgi:hypothetical protein